MVCLGNICRSPLAEGILANKIKNQNIIVDSAGTSNYHIGKKPDHRSIEIALKHNINIKNQKARQFTRQDFDNFDIIYTMDYDNYKDVISLATSKQEKDKVRMIISDEHTNNQKSVPDPYLMGKDNFKEVFDILNNACEKIISQIG